MPRCSVEEISWSFPIRKASECVNGMETANGLQFLRRHQTPMTEGATAGLRGERERGEETRLGKAARTGQNRNRRGHAGGGAGMFVGTCDAERWDECFAQRVLVPGDRHRALELVDGCPATPDPFRAGGREQPWPGLAPFGWA